MSEELPKNEQTDSPLVHQEGTVGGKNSLDSTLHTTANQITHTLDPSGQWGIGKAKAHWGEVEKRIGGSIPRGESTIWRDLDDIPADNLEIEDRAKPAPFIPSTVPVTMYSPPIKSRFFSTLRNGMKGAIKSTGNTIQKYWKGAVAVWASAVLATTTQSDSHKKTTHTQIATVSSVETILTPTHDKAPEENITPRTITPFEKSLLTKTTETSTLLGEEDIFGKKAKNTQKEPEKQVIVPEVPSEPTQTPIVTNISSEEPSPIPLYVISDGEKTVYITDRNGDKKLSVDEQRLAYFDAVGGNYEKNTKKMYNLATDLNLTTSNIASKNLTNSTGYPDITEGTPVTKTLTVNGLIYTISANTDLALKLGERKLAKTDTILTENKTQTNGENIPKVSSGETIPRALPVPDPVIENIPRAIPVFEDALVPSEDPGFGVLPPKNAPILPMFDTSETHITQRAHSYQDTREYVLRNGVYEGSSQTLLPTDKESARSTLESWLGTVDAIREVSTDPKQKQLTLKEFYTNKITIVDASQKTIPISLATFLKKHAHYTDLQIAQVMGKKIPAHMVDSDPYDGKLSGTFDMNGWVAARGLVNKGAKNLYGEFPTTEQYDEYFRNNVSLESHPEIKNYFQFILHVEREIRKESR